MCLYPEVQWIKYCLVKEVYLLGCTTMLSGGSQLKFQMNILPPFAGPKHKPLKIPAWSRQQSKWHFNGRHCIILQETEVLITTGVRLSSSTFPLKDYFSLLHLFWPSPPSFWSTRSCYYFWASALSVHSEPQIPHHKYKGKVIPLHSQVPYNACGL